MREDLKRFEAVFAERTEPGFRIATIRFYIEDDKDALDVAETRMEINLSNLPNGVYYYRAISMNREPQTGKMIIEK